MRFSIIGMLALLCSCGPRLVFHSSQEMSRDQLLARSSHVFVGVIEKQEFVSWPPFRFELPVRFASDPPYWKILRRDIRGEQVLRGAEPSGSIPIYEIFWAGGASGDWNSTQTGGRYLFLTSIEGGRYHVVGDWWRSIFSVTTGPHTHLPLDESRELLERIALMNYHIERDDDSSRIQHPYFQHFDPGEKLSLWRTTKLLRGLSRHPNPAIRVPACRELLMYQMGQDECWDSLPESDRGRFHDGGYVCCDAKEIEARRRAFVTYGTEKLWDRNSHQDSRRLLTACSDGAMRAQFCRLYEKAYPTDTDNGCPPQKPPPATIVTDLGDVPLIGPWPR